MTGEQLLTISTFARTVGIPASALRHYAAHGVLLPEEVDASSGYRYYSTDQIHDGTMVRTMRTAGLPLELMRGVLREDPRTAAELLEAWISEEDRRSRDASTQLRRLVEDLSSSSTSSGTARLEAVGAHLATALLQVAAAAVTAEASVSGIVWDLGPEGLSLIATDRYWLAHRRVRSHGDGRLARTICTADSASEIAALCRTEATVRIQVEHGELQIRDTSGALTVRSPTVQREVPDLGRLVSTQPPPQILAGLSRAELLRILETADGRCLARISLDGTGAVVKARDQVTGWASRRPGDHHTLTITLDPRLLAAAIRACPGEEVLLGLIDEGTPVQVQSPTQDSFTALVMPFRP